MIEITQADRDAAGTWLNNTPAVEDWCGYEDQRALVQAFARHRKYGYDQGYYDGRKLDGEEERAAIVAWLRQSIVGGDALEPVCDTHEQIAAAIEAGEHLK